MSGLNFKALKGNLTTSAVSKLKKITNKKRDAQLKEIKRIKEEKLLLTAEERLITIHKDPEADDRYIWSVVLYTTIFTTISTLLASMFITHELEYHSSTLDLLDSYDGGSYFSLLECQFMSIIVTNGTGCFIMKTANMRIRRGRMRYMIYAYTGWCLGSCLSLIGTAVQCVSLIVARKQLFMDGFFLSMMVYGRNSDKAHKIHNMQTQYQCCGSYDFKEWLAITWNDQTAKNTHNIPESCCDLKNYTRDLCVREALHGHPEKLTPWPKGCVEKLLEIFVYLIVMVLVVVSILLLIEISLLFMVVMKFGSIKSYQNLLVEERVRLALKRLAIHKKRRKKLENNTDQSRGEKYKTEVKHAKEENNIPETKILK